MAKSKSAVDAAAEAVQQAMNDLHAAEEAHKAGGPAQPAIDARIRLRDANAAHGAAVEAEAAAKKPKPPAAEA